MIDFTKTDWESIKSLCNKVAEKNLEKRANDLGLNFIFDINIGIYELRVYSVLYQRIPNKPDIEFAKFNEYDYYKHKDEFEAYLAEVERLLDEGITVDKKYEKELAELNSRYGK